MAESPKMRSDAEAAIEREQRETALAMQTQREQARRRNAGIPKRFKASSFDGFDARTPEQRDVRDCLQAYVRHFASATEHGQCAILIGPPGTGKTHLGVATLAAVLRQRYSALYTTVLDLTMAVRETYRTGASESVVIHRYSEIGLLFLDEIGVQSGSDHERLTLHTILDARYRECRPTLIAGNVAQDEIAGYLGERVFSRPHEGNPLLLVTSWSDYRKSGSGQA